MNQKIQRNDPCPCGSGKKYKQCCMKNQQQNVKTYTPDGKRKFKAKLLSSAGAVQSLFLGQGSKEQQQSADSSVLDKMRIGKTEEDYQVGETATPDLVSEERKVPRIRKMAPHQPGEEFKPTTEDFSQ